MKNLSFKLNEHEELLWEFYKNQQKLRDIHFKSEKQVLITLLSQYKMSHLKDWRDYSGKE